MTNNEFSTLAQNIIAELEYKFPCDEITRESRDKIYPYIEKILEILDESPISTQNIVSHAWHVILNIENAIENIFPNGKYSIDELSIDGVEYITRDYISYVMYRQFFPIEIREEWCREYNLFLWTTPIK